MRSVLVIWWRFGKWPQPWVVILELKSPSIGCELVPAICMQCFGQASQVYTSRGQVVYVHPSYILFSLPQFVSPAELGPLIPHLPTQIVEQYEEGKLQLMKTAVPRKVGAHLIEKMLQLNKLADEVYRKYADRCDRAWEIMTCSSHTNIVHLEDVAMFIFQQKDRASISIPMLWCIYRVLIFNPGFIRNGHDHRLDPYFTIISKQKYRDRQTVAKWVREYQEQLASDSITDSNDAVVASEADQGHNPVGVFARKARKLIRSNREIRDAHEHGPLGPGRIPANRYPINISDTSGGRNSFKRDEMIIIRFLYEWVVERAIASYTHLGSVGPSILRAVGMYASFDLDRPTGLLLLQELGILLPWENQSGYSPKYILPGQGMESTIDKLREVASSSVLAIEDSMADLRKDWGNLPVFCIDSAQTTEVDDGISWEAIDEATCWVHIHVANPSAFIKPDSPIAQYAARLTQTIYLPERRYLMLESESLHRHCSLAANTPTISFSARLNTDGEILETKVSHGIIRKVKRGTYEALNSALSNHASDDSKSEDSATALTIGGEMPSESTTLAGRSLTEPETFTESEGFILRKLMQVGQARRFKRLEGTDLERRQSVSSLLDTKVYLGENHPPFGPCMTHSRVAYGDPIISLDPRPFSSDELQYVSLGNQMVGDIMLLAGEIGARWCTERGIPIGYAGTQSSSQQQLSKRKYLDEVYDPIVARYGHVPALLKLSIRAFMGRSSLSAQPIVHEHLNTAQYARVTSPLRRFNDLWTHWQIDAAVRQEARTGTSLVGNTDQSFLPFNLDDTRRFVKELRKTNSDVAHMTKLTRRHWVVQWFNRAYYYNEAPLPKPLHICIISMDPVLNSIKGVIKELGICCVIQPIGAAKAQAPLEVGDTWEADVHQMNPCSLRIAMKPVRLVKKSPIDFQSYMHPRSA